MSEARTTYLVDGVPLDDPDGRWRLEAATRLPAPAGRRHALLETPRRPSVLQVPGQSGTGTVNLSLVVDGAGGRLDRGVLADRLSMLARVFDAAQAVTLRSPGRPDRSAVVHQAVVAEPAAVGRAATVAIQLTVAPFWHEPTARTQTLDAETGQTLAFTTFAGTTGRYGYANGMFLRVRGPFTRLELWDPNHVTGLFFTKPLAANKTLTLTGTDWFSSPSLGLDYPPGGPLEIWPVIPSGSTDPALMRPELVVSGSGIAEGVAVRLNSPRSYL